MANNSAYMPSGISTDDLDAITRAVELTTARLAELRARRNAAIRACLHAGMSERSVAAHAGVSAVYVHKLKQAAN